ncbi:hypothetical protein [Pontibacter beigongshangensis]|uniref:hypothetical protein n=1 Tax=Pontibacter beigongshangensis TaxID=2574733 RepID=UPI0016508D3B|nr:hypothetical protein [Pontibacter beigongshangensis]
MANRQILNKMPSKENLPTNAQIVKFQMLNELADSIYTEMKEFAKKKPDDPLNKFKVKNINRVLSQLKEFLKDEPTIDFLDHLDDESLPSNSDAILIIGQFKASMDNFRNKYTNQYRRWRTVENPQGKAVE